MSLSKRIKQKTDQVIAKFAKPQPKPQPTHGTVTGFSQGLIQVSTSDGQQLRQQQGTRAIGVGDKVIAHDNTAVFTGEAGVLPKPGRVFISAPNKKPKFAQQYFAYLYYEMFIEGYGWRKYDIFPISGNDYSSRPSFDYSDPGFNWHNPIRNLRLIISDGRGKTARVRRWEDQRMAIETSFGSRTYPQRWRIDKPIFFHYNGLIGMHWELRSDTDLSRPETGSYGTSTRITYHAALFTPKLEEVRTETIGTRAYTSLLGVPNQTGNFERLSHPYFQLRHYLVPGTRARYPGGGAPSVPYGVGTRPDSLTTIEWSFWSFVTRQDYSSQGDSILSAMYYNTVATETTTVEAIPGVDNPLSEYERLISATELDLDPNLSSPENHAIANRPFFEGIGSFVLDDRNRDQNAFA
jgi:hypothetical protein